ncbi:MAG: 50S ribosomal protein L22 [Candidatus Zixiibacteriota bacterium]|nr:MAG: 50S ribosomal protein L22 [candidate division Zixibacteria bacterium]
MEYQAQLRFLRMSPRKLRRVGELVVGSGVDEALDTLLLTPKAAAQAIARVVKSAASNAIAREGSAKIKSEDLFVRSITVDSGPTLKRIRPASMGRAFRIRRRSSHLKVVIEARRSETDRRKT